MGIMQHISGAQLWAPAEKQLDCQLDPHHQTSDLIIQLW